MTCLFLSRIGEFQHVITNKLMYIEVIQDHCGLGKNGDSLSGHFQPIFPEFKY